MSDIENKEERPFPRLAYSNDEDPPKHGRCWLLDREIGEVFLCNDKSMSIYIQPKFALRSKDEDTCQLWYEASGEFVDVHPGKFCLRYDFVKTISIIENHPMYPSEDKEE